MIITKVWFNITMKGNKTVKEIYDYFHQFPNADKKSA